MAEGLAIEFVHDADDQRILYEYRTAMVNVLPSVHRACYGDYSAVPELMGFTLLEAQACGTPVICTDAGAMHEFEILPPEWVQPYMPFLAIREFDQDKWSNLLHQYETTPCGAGLCVRKKVADNYAVTVEQNSNRLGLGRKGKQLISCEDSDLAFTACDIGLGTGQFMALKLTHLIPKSRLEESYLLKLIEGHAYSGVILESLWGKTPSHMEYSWKGKFFELYKLLKMKPRDRRFYQAHKKGRLQGIKEVLILE